MAREKDPWKRFQERERERELEREREEQLKNNTPGAIPSASEINTDHLDRILDQAKTLMSQLEGLYHQYIIGLEKRPPIEKRAQLDKLMEQMFMAPKPTQGIRFRFQSLQASYHTHRDKWDRQLRDLESGKIKRVVKR